MHGMLEADSMASNRERENIYVQTIAVKNYNFRLDLYMHLYVFFKQSKK